MTLRIGISTCPNDTFSFAALVEGRVEAPELEWTLDDVEALNAMLFARSLDIGKASFHAALALDADYEILPVGAALGYGVGPLLLAARADAGWPDRTSRVLAPGRWTTAALLYRLFVRDGASPEHCVFSEIMPALERGEADYGVVIHEGRFTFADHGLFSVADLGELWEADTGAPLPLGGILARRALGRSTIDTVTRAIRASLEFALADPESAVPLMSRHAQECSREVLDQHVRLYVNDATLDLGVEGRRALRLLRERARVAGAID